MKKGTHPPHPNLTLRSVFLRPRVNFTHPNLFDHTWGTEQTSGPS